MTSSRYRRRLPEHVADAMTAILDYLWLDEARDYLAMSREEQQTHIFNEMLIVQNWLTPRRQKQGEGHDE